MGRFSRLVCLLALTGVMVLLSLVRPGVAEEVHQWGPETLEAAATCVSPARYSQVCVNCGERKTVTRGDVDMNAHQFSSWSVETEPDRAGDGMQKRVCRLCGFSDTVALPRLTGNSGNSMQTLDDLPILQKSCKPEDFSFTFQESGSVLTVAVSNLPSNWDVQGAVYTDGDYRQELEDIVTEDRVTWTLNLPQYITEYGCTFLGVRIGYYDGDTGVTEYCVYSADGELTEWYLQDDMEGTTLSFDTDQYWYYPDETGETVYIYGMDHQLISGPSGIARPQLDVDHDDRIGTDIQGWVTIPEGAVVVYVEFGRLDEDDVFHAELSYLCDGENDTFTVPGIYTAEPGWYKLIATAWTHETYSDDPSVTENDSDPDFLIFELEDAGLPGAPEVTIDGYDDLADPYVPIFAVSMEIHQEPSVTYAITVADGLAADAYAYSWTRFDASSHEILNEQGMPVSPTAEGSGILWLNDGPGMYEITFWCRVDGVWSVSAVRSVLVLEHGAVPAPQVFFEYMEISDELELSLDGPMMLNIEAQTADAVSLELHYREGSQDEVILMDAYTVDMFSLDLSQVISQAGDYELKLCVEKEGWLNGSASITIHVLDASPLPSGICGDGLTWELGADGVLRISGTGGMYDFGPESSPWPAEDVMEVIVDHGVTSIGSYSFYGCEWLSHVSLSNTVERISDYAFGGYNHLTKIVIPAGVTYISPTAFLEAPYITNFMVYVGNPVYTAVDGVLMSKDKTVLLSVPAGKTGDYTVPAGVTEIGAYAFAYLDLDSLTLPDSLTWIGEFAFMPYAADGELYYDGTAEQWAQIGIATGNDVLTNIMNSGHLHFIGPINECGPSLSWSLDGGVLTFSGFGEMYDYEYETAPWYSQADEITGLSLPEGMTVIGSYAFANCRGLTSVDLPAGITRIGEGAFINCDSLVSAVIPDSVEEIGAFAFNGCFTLTGIGLPAQLSILGEGAFSDCREITAVILPDGLATIPAKAFSDCVSLSSVTLPAGSFEIRGYAFAGCPLTALELPIGAAAQTRAFYVEVHGQGELYCVTLPDNAGYISPTAFWHTGMQVKPGFVTPAELVTIESEAFYGISADYVYLSDGVKSIGNSAFAGNAHLACVRIPSGCVTIGADAFPMDVTLLVPMDYDTAYLKGLGYQNILVSPDPNSYD